LLKIAETDVWIITIKRVNLEWSAVSLVINL